MKFKIYNIPASDSDDWLIEMNKFLETHKVIQVNRNCSVVNDHLYWSFCVEYLESIVSYSARAVNSNGGGNSGVDYKEVLPAEQFLIYDKLRRARKRIGEENPGKPLYVFFKNEELAEISKLPEINVDAIKRIKGIGEKRALEYGTKLIEYYNAIILQDNALSEQSEQPKQLEEQSELFGQSEQPHPADTSNVLF
jgi:superfamily II DNA helicase RecQ